jgi:hypothetical protein
VQYFARTRPQLVTVPAMTEVAGGAAQPDDDPKES